jgi:NAD(P)-dependent dehydrogenase (short-subunit alcohol dehydrogenase family)
MNNIDLNRRHAFITRDAQGIGLAISRRILASGASVSLWDRNVKLLASVSAELSGKGSSSEEGVDVAGPNHKTNTPSKRGSR